MNKLITSSLFRFYFENRFWSGLSINLILFLVIIPRDVSIALYKSFNSSSWFISVLTLFILQLLKGIVGKQDLQKNFNNFVFSLPLKSTDHRIFSVYQQFIYSIPFWILLLLSGVILGDYQALFFAAVSVFIIDITLSFLAVPKLSFFKIKGPTLPPSWISFIISFFKEFISQNGKRLLVSVSIIFLLNLIILASLQTVTNHPQTPYLNFMQGFLSCYLIGLYRPSLKTLLSSGGNWLSTLPHSQMLKFVLSTSTYLIILLPSLIVMGINSGQFSITSLVLNTFLALIFSNSFGKYFTVTYFFLCFGEIYLLGKLL